MNVVAFTPLPPSEATILGVLRALRPLQALSAGLRALPITPDRVDGGERSGAPCEHASDRGTLTAARALYVRLTQVHDPAARATLVWLIDRSHVETSLDVLSATLAAETAPIAMRDAHIAAHARAKLLRATADGATRRSRTYARDCRGASTITPALADARTAAEAAEAAAASAEAVALRTSRELVAWGHARITSAVAAWMAVRA